MKIKDKYINFITDEKLSNSLKEIINTFGTEEKLKDCYIVCDTIYDRLLREKLISDQSQYHEKYIDILFFSALTHNLFFDYCKYVKKPGDYDYTTLLSYRQKLGKIFEENQVLVADAMAVFQILEGQCGTESPVPFLAPQNNLMGYMLYEAIWITYKYRLNRI